jgi:hypothetical protein
MASAVTDLRCREGSVTIQDSDFRREGCGAQSESYMESGAAGKTRGVAKGTI